MLGIRQSVLITLLIAFLLSYNACNRDTSGVTGKYMAQIGEGEQSMTVLLELGENGTGSWAVEEDNVNFRWEVREKDILLHTKSGGVIVGSIVGETIDIYLPGVGVHTFKKIRP